MVHSFSKTASFFSVVEMCQNQFTNFKQISKVVWAQRWAQTTFEICLKLENTKHNISKARIIENISLKLHMVTNHNGCEYVIKRKHFLSSSITIYRRIVLLTSIHTPCSHPTLNNRGWGSKTNILFYYDFAFFIK